MSKDTAESPTATAGTPQKKTTDFRYAVPKPVENIRLSERTVLSSKN